MQMPCEETEKMSYILGENICKLVVVKLLSCEFSKSTNKNIQLENGQNSLRLKRIDRWNDVQYH